MQVGRAGRAGLAASGQSYLIAKGAPAKSDGEPAALPMNGLGMLLQCFPHGLVWQKHTQMRCMLP